MIRAVVFDLDNTLYDYDHCNALAEKTLFRTVSETFEITEEKASSLLKKAKITIKEYLGSEVAASHNRLLYMQNICEQMQKNPLIYAMKFYDAYWDCFLENMTLFPHVIPLMDHIKKHGMKIGIITDLTAHIQYRKIEVLGIQNRIDHLVTSEEAGIEKPGRRIFELMLQKMELSPEEVLMVGDSEAKDIKGALNVGMRAFMYVRGTDNVQQEMLRIMGRD